MMIEILAENGVSTDVQDSADEPRLNDEQIAELHRRYERVLAGKGKWVSFAEMVDRTDARLRELGATDKMIEATRAKLRAKGAPV